MFGLFKKPVGVHIRDNEIVAVELAKDSKVPKLGKVIRVALPEGTIKDGSILNEAVLAQKLIELSAQINIKDCNFALPVSKCFSAVLKFPSATKDSMIEQSLPEKITSVLPASMEALYVEKKIIRRGKDEEVLLVLAAVEKTVLQQYLKLFTAAGVKDPGYVLENKALARAVPVKLKDYKALMFAHAFEDGALLSSVYEACLFDSLFAKDLKVHFSESYTSYYQQVGIAPSHIILSGSSNLLAEFSKIQFNGTKPELVSAEFTVNVEGSDQVQDDLVVATGLALLGSGGKKDGQRLISLLD